MKLRYIIMLLILVTTAFAGRKEYKEDILSYRNEFKEYDYKRLEQLADSLLNGELDTTLAIPSMVDKFVNTSRLKGNVKIKFQLSNRFNGLYLHTDSSIILNTRLNKKQTIETLLHELTHHIQFSHGYYGNYATREKRVINELYADYISARYIKSTSYRQPPTFLARYTVYRGMKIDKFVHISHYIHEMYMRLTERLERL